MREPTSIPAEPVLNGALTKEKGIPVIKLDVLPIQDGDPLRLRFRSSSGDWRQGIWLGVDGAMEVAGTEGDQFTIWKDTAPESFQVNILRTVDGRLRLYNVWDSGRGRRRESHSATSGMLKETEPDGTIVYRCNDIGLNPRFDKLVFEVRLP